MKIECPFCHASHERTKVRKYYGPRRTALMICLDCDSCFSEKRSMFWRAHYPDHMIKNVFKYLKQGWSYRKTASEVGIDKDTITRWVKRYSGIIAEHVD